MANLNIIRPVGLQESYSTTRHNLNFYVGVSTSAFYTLPTDQATLSQDELKSTIHTALSILLPQHPMLCVTIVNEGKRGEEAFVGLEQVDLDAVTRVCNIDESGLDPIVQGEIRLNFKSAMEKRLPLWRLVIAIPQDEGERKKGVWIVWSFHHAGLDGSSGPIFHKGLLNALNKIWTKQLHIPTSTSSPIIHIDQASLHPFPPKLEAAHNLPLSFKYLAKAVWGSIRGTPPPPEFWSGAPPFSPPGGVLQTRLKTITIDHNTVTSIVEKSRRVGVTITTLLQSVLACIILRNLALPAGNTCIKVGAPISMRRWLTGFSAADRDGVMGNYVGVFVHEYNANDFAMTKGIWEGEAFGKNGLAYPEVVVERIWTQATNTRRQLQELLDKQGKDTGVGLLRYVTDMEKYFLDKIGKAREEGLEVSNLGLVKICDEFENERQRRLERVDGEPRELWEISEIRFAQSNSVTGPAVIASVVSVEHGPLAIGFSWLEGVMEEEKMLEVVEEVETVLKGLAANSW